MKKLFTPIATAMALFVAGSATAQCSSGEAEVTVTVVEDNYGSETEWEITGVGGTPVYLSGGPYADGNNGTSHTDQVCIPAGTDVVFKITDEYGDGMCCSYGNGSFTVTMNECDIVVIGGEFGDETSHAFQIKERNSVDLKLESLDLDPVVVMGNIDISGNVVNIGDSAITSFDLNYSIDNGIAVTQNVTGVSIDPCASYAFTHDSVWNAATPGSYDVLVWVSNINGNGDDGDTLNDVQEASVLVATNSVNHLPLVEELTSSTCPPCASLNASFDPLLVNTLHANEPNGTVAAIKYQMDWPSPGTDPSYNQDGEKRRAFYGTTGIPDEYLDGAPIPSPTSATDYNAAAAKSAFVNIDLSFTVDSLTINATAVVTPYADLSGPVKLYMGVTEDHYSYFGGTTSQKQYYYAMRKMLPNGNGIALNSLMADTPVTFTESYDFSIGNVAQNNYNLWAQSGDITLVAWVQNTATKEVYQAAFSNGEADTTGIYAINHPPSNGINEEAANIGLKVYPNPFSDVTNVVYNLDQSKNISYSIYNAMGQVVYNNDLGIQLPGKHNFTIDANELSAGIYVLDISVGDRRATQRISITK